MSNVDELKEQLVRVLGDLRQCIDTSVQIRAKNKQDAKAVAKVWELFLGSFIQYIHQKGRETGQNLMADISFRSIWRR